MRSAAVWFAVVLALLGLVMPELAYAQEATGLAAQINAALEPVDKTFGELIVAPVAAVLFFDIVFWDNTLADGSANPANVAIPFVVAWLVSGAIFFTLRMNFVNLVGFL